MLKVTFCIFDVLIIVVPTIYTVLYANRKE